MSGPAQSTHRVELWFARTDVLSPHALQAARDTLSEQDAARIHAIRHEDTQREALVARGLLRLVLSERLGTAPHAVRFETTGRGKPVLAAEYASPVQFNLTHAGGRVGLALTEAVAVGIDLEGPRRLPGWMKIARRYFSPAEVAAIEAQPADQQEAAFFTGWVRKEALVKAHGGGIAQGLAGFDVEVRPDRPPALLGSRDGEIRPDAWTLVDLHPEPAYRGALALASSGRCELDWQSLPAPMQ